MGFVEIAVCFMILVIIFTIDLLISLFINWIGDEDGFGYFVMMFISCGALSVLITYLLFAKGVI